MSSEQGNSNATWGEGTHESKQVQQNDLSSTTETPDIQGFVIPPIEPEVVDPPQVTRSTTKDRLSHL